MKGVIYIVVLFSSFFSACYIFFILYIKPYQGVSRRNSSGGQPEGNPVPPTNPPDPDSFMYSWDTQKHNWHNTRVLCDKSGLSLNEKDLICSVIFQESRFLNSAKNDNKDGTGKVLSTDWGICQINDYWHIKKYPDFPSVKYVLDHPEKCVQFMIDHYLQGSLGQWVGYSSGAYQQWLAPNSPMWNLRT